MSNDLKGEIREKILKSMYYLHEKNVCETSP